MKNLILTLSIVTVLAGCVDEPPPPPTAQALSEMAGAYRSRTAPAASSTPHTGPAVTFLDSPRLQDGPGKVDEDVATEFTTTESGLKYRILRKSDGKKPTASNSVEVNYRGWLDNGNEFDGNYGKSPISFGLNGVIGGWTEGLQLIGVGGMIELWIPSELGYGTSGSGATIPPNAELHFVVELLAVQ